MIDVLARNWGWVALRGAVAVIFGLSTLFHPGVTLVTLVLVYGAFAFADGFIAIISVITNRRSQPQWASLLLGGLAGMAVGVLTFVLPAVTATVLLLLVAAWAIISGVAEIVAALRLRKAISGEWMLMLAGLLSVTFGVMLLARPGAGALAVILWIGTYAVVLGLVWLGLALRLRRWNQHPPTAALFRHA
jgi:uncharacterized membrane protein HdeD (DUF308 family)